MKKKLASLFLALCIIIALSPAPALAAEGDGTENQPQLISDLAALEAFRDYINSGNTGAGEYFKLTADIDMSEKYSETTGVSWEMIGNTSENLFQGTFDGGGHTISGLYINKTGPGDEYGLDEGALFGFVEGGTIQNLNVRGYVSVAAIVGDAAGIAVVVWDGAILNCSFDGVVECPNYVAAGIVAEGSGIISGCKTSGKIIGEHLVGGIMGTVAADDCTIINCVNESEITGTLIAGGIAAFCDGRIERCVNRGSVTGRPFVPWWFTEEELAEFGINTSFEIGGIAGCITGSTIIENCCNTGTVSGNTDVGGIIGIAYSYDEDRENLACVKNCFNIGSVTSTLETDGEHNIGSIAGTIVRTIYDHDADAEVCLPGVATAELSNCYYLAGTAAGGISSYGDIPDAAIEKTANEFASGEVAYCLQKGNGGNTASIVWGQALAADGLPVLTDNAEEVVYKVTFVADETEYAVNYANPNGPAALPSNPTKSGYTFGGWYREAACTNAWDFAADTVTADMTLYAKWTKNSTGGGHSVFVPAPAPTPTSAVERFADISSGAWYYDSVKYAVDKGLFYGTSDTAFSPNGTMTRGMLATVLYRLAKEPISTANNLFSDVADGSYYTGAIAWAAEQGIMLGYRNGRFGPEDFISREQLAAILWRYAGSPESSGSLDNFTDRESISAWALPALQWAIEQHIVSGKSNGILDPGGTATRAEVAAMLMRYMENIK